MTVSGGKWEVFRLRAGEMAHKGDVLAHAHDTARDYAIVLNNGSALIGLDKDRKFQDDIWVVRKVEEVNEFGPVCP